MKIFIIVRTNLYKRQFLYFIYFHIINRWKSTIERFPMVVVLKPHIGILDTNEDGHSVFNLFVSNTLNYHFVRVHRGKGKLSTRPINEKSS